MSNKKFIYVGGYGRSGSTILGILLGSHSGYHHMGAVAHLPKLAIEEDIECPCGKAYAACSEWSGRIPDNAIAMRDLSRNIEGMPGIRSLVAGKSARREYQIGWSLLLDSVLEGCGGKTLVDTSKTSYTSALRPIALKRLLGLQVYLILLVRDPREVANSKLKGNNNKLASGDESIEHFAGFKAIVGWTLANAYALVNCFLLGPDKRFIVYYDDLMKNPHGVINGLGGFLGDDLSDIKSAMCSAEGIEPGHLVGGNRLARRERVRFEPPVSDFKYLKLHHYLLYFILAKPLDMLLRKMRFRCDELV